MTEIQSTSAGPESRVHHSRVMGRPGRNVSRAGRRMGRDARRIGPKTGGSSGVAALIICVLVVAGGLAFGLTYIH